RPAPRPSGRTAAGRGLRAAARSACWCPRSLPLLCEGEGCPGGPVQAARPGYALLPLVFRQFSPVSTAADVLECGACPPPSFRFLSVAAPLTTPKSFSCAERRPTLQVALPECQPRRVSLSGALPERRTTRQGKPESVVMPRRGQAALRRPRGRGQATGMRRQNVQHCGT